ncbi:ATP-binding protein [Streptomyces sp. NPDC005077]|uniref:ATP-binding protein n=1 Tax=Streptomyces sp. NPDC005077 TaxID=3154292 RepID=UPI0033B30764
MEPTMTTTHQLVAQHRPSRGDAAPDRTSSLPPLQAQPRLGLAGMEVSYLRTTNPDGHTDAADAVRPAQVRRIVRAQLRHWGLAPLMNDAALLVSELVTNAFQHGTGVSVDVRLARSRECIRIDVTDGSPQAPQPRSAELLDESGRGLLLVDAIADAWGVSPDGTTTWCSLPLPLAPGRAAP